MRSLFQAFISNNSNNVLSPNLPEVALKLQFSLIQREISWIPKTTSEVEPVGGWVPAAMGREEGCQSEGFS